MRKVQAQAGPRAIAGFLGRSSRAALARRGFAQSDVLSHWDSIVGPNLANCSSPERLNYGKGSSKEATLRVRVAPGWAPEFQHFEQLIIERINSFFGYRAVARLQIIQAPVNKPTPKKRPAPAPLTTKQEDWIRSTVEDVKDADLKDRLTSVASSMLGARNAKTSQQEKK